MDIDAAWFNKFPKLSTKGEQLSPWTNIGPNWSFSHAIAHRWVWLHQRRFLVRLAFRTSATSVDRAHSGRQPHEPVRQHLRVRPGGCLEGHGSAGRGIACVRAAQLTRHRERAALVETKRVTPHP